MSANLHNLLVVLIHPHISAFLINVNAYHCQENRVQASCVQHNRSLSICSPLPFIVQLSMFLFDCLYFKNPFFKLIPSLGAFFHIAEKMS